jgi:hypothetical protein
MAEVASREGLIQVMRDLLAAPDQFDWLATGWRSPASCATIRSSTAAGRRPAELSAATSDRLRGRNRPAGFATTCPATCCRPTWTWCSTAWWPGWPPVRTHSGCPPLDLVEDSVRQR